MPKELHDRLARQAKKKGLTGDRRNAYIYGTMNKIEKKANLKKFVRMLLGRGGMKSPITNKVTGYKTPVGRGGIGKPKPVFERNILGKAKDYAGQQAGKVKDFASEYKYPLATGTAGLATGGGLMMLSPDKAQAGQPSAGKAAPKPATSAVPESPAKTPTTAPGPSATKPKTTSPTSLLEKVKGMHPGLLAALGIGVPLAGYGAYKAMGGGEEEKEKQSDDKLMQKAAATIVCGYLDDVAVKMVIEKRASIQALQRSLSAGYNINSAMKVAYPHLSDNERNYLTSKIVKRATEWLDKQSNAQMGYTAQSAMGGSPAMSGPSSLGSGNSVSASMPAGQGVGAMKANMGY